MKLEIFDVEHGQCSLVMADDNTRLMIDCGHHATTGWQPGTCLRERNVTTLDMLAVTNFDEDHLSGASDLFDKVHVAWLWRNASLTPAILRVLKAETGGVGTGTERLLKELSTTFSGAVATPAPPPAFAGMERHLFCTSYPTFQDTNNLSAVVFLKLHGVGVMFTGDLERPGFTELLKDPSFRTALGATRIYVAPHHGRESGCSEEAKALLTSVNYVVISDKGYEHETQKTDAFYRSIAKGGPYGGDPKRFILTTRTDNTIRFNFTPISWGPA